MTHPTSIPAALTETEWSLRSVLRENALDVCIGDGGTLTIGADQCESYSTHCAPDNIVAIIALANAALPDTDPRKLTWAHVDLIRNSLKPMLSDHELSDEDFAEVERVEEAKDALAALIESYLPPR